MPEKKKTGKWMNLDEVFPSACIDCSHKNKDKTYFGSDGFIKKCEECRPRKDYNAMSQGLGHVHNASNETFTHHEISHEAMAWL